MIAARLVLSVLVGLCGIAIAARVCVAAAASGEYAQAIPGVVMGGLLVAYGAYRIVLLLRARNAQRR
jgi:hypothetical protein